MVRFISVSADVILARHCRSLYFSPTSSILLSVDLFIRSDILFVSREHVNCMSRMFIAQPAMCSRNILLYFLLFLLYTIYEIVVSF